MELGRNLIINQLIKSKAIKDGERKLYEYAHMYIMYSYEEGSWSYVVSDIQPELSGIRTGTGYAKPTEVQGKIKNNVVDFTVWLSSDYGLSMVTVRAVVDNYGGVTVFILNI